MKSKYLSKNFQSLRRTRAVSKCGDKICFVLCTSGLRLHPSLYQPGLLIGQLRKGNSYWLFFKRKWQYMDKAVDAEWIIHQCSFPLYSFFMWRMTNKILSFHAILKYVSWLITWRGSKEGVWETAHKGPDGVWDLGSGKTKLIMRSDPRVIWFRIWEVNNFYSVSRVQKDEY